MSKDRIFRLTANPLAKPKDLDLGYVARVHAMLDAFVAAAPENSQLSFHESRTSPFLPYAIVAWAVGRYPVRTHLATTSGRTYEVWHIEPNELTIVVFPRERLLYGLDPDIQSKIDKIRREADERIKTMLESETAALAQAEQAVSCK